MKGLSNSEKPNKSEIPTGSTTKENLGVREFEEIVVEYPPEDLCTYPEYRGKPYFSIKYKEGNNYFIGYGTYNPRVLSRYLKDYFMPTTKNDLGGDLISREQVLEQVEKWRDYEFIRVTNPLYYLRKRLNDLPSVAPKQKTEHWILLDECANSGYYCSNCQKKVVKEGWSDTVKKIKFCPNCGAKMVESEEADD